MRLPIGIARGAGLVIHNPPGNPVYQPLRSGHGDLHLHWQPVYQDVIRSVGPLCAFLPSATYEGSGEKVVFSQIENGRELLSLSRPLGRNEGIPDDVLASLESALRSFKAIAQREGTSPDVRRFVEEFTLPSILRFPDAYRVYQAGPFSRRRYFILWGFEPIGLTSLTRGDIGQVQMELRDRGATSWAGIGTFARLLAILCLMAVLSWIAAYLLLPEPRASFTIVATANQMATVENTSSTDKTFGIDFGSTAYLWSFEGAEPSQSAQSSPQPVWTTPGVRKVSLEVTHSSILGLSKSDNLVREFTVTPADSPAQITPVPIITPDPVNPGDNTENRKNSKDDDSSKGGGGDIPGHGADGDESQKDKVTTRGTGNEGSNSSDGVKSDNPGQGSNNNHIPPPPSDIPETNTSGTTRKSTGSEDPKREESRNELPNQSPPSEIDRNPLGRESFSDANLIWYRIVPANQDPDSFIVTMDVEPPQGYRVVKVSFNGAERSYTGRRFDQLVNNGSNAVVIEIEHKDGTGTRRRLAGNWLFRLSTGAGQKPSKSSPGQNGEPDESSRTVDPNKVANLTA